MCSGIPDLDVIGFRFGIHYGDFWGHRGFTHSLVFAALLASVVAVVMTSTRVTGIGRFALFVYLFLATASHGVLDAITNGGLGVAFFSPFDNTRYFLPWRPVSVSPMASLGSSPREVSPSSKVNFCGFGFLPYCSVGGADAAPNQSSRLGDA